VNEINISNELPALPEGATVVHGGRHGEEYKGVHGKHWLVTFANGYELDVVEAYSTYGVEAAIYGPDGKLFGDDVHGWVTPEQLADLIRQVSGF
jgi:hypothetical protein